MLPIRRLAEEGFVDTDGEILKEVSTRPLTYAVVPSSSALRIVSGHNLHQGHRNCEHLCFEKGVRWLIGLATGHLLA